ncbi:MAG: gluconate 2-dehydrogenase subunit 3 family protein [Acidobacteria bacterium]|nr:gluconate 2-dehydrogenase subunit 3 family protein [Acidobacteriota bacterium]
MRDDRNTSQGAKLKRRDMLKAITAVPAAALIPLGSATAAEQQEPKTAAEAQTIAVYHRKVLTAHEWETVKALSDLIIPADERSGSASEAGVPQFIDDWLDFQGGDLLAEIRGGLVWLDLECKHQFGHEFVGCAPMEQKKILDRIAYPDKASPEDSNYVAFFNRFRDLVVEGFFSSEMGVKDLPYLGNKVVADWEGCPTNVLAQVDENLRTQGVGLSLQTPEEEYKN